MPRKAAKGRTHTAGLGRKHQLARERLLRAHVDGSPCPECQRPLCRDAWRNHDGRPPHADHHPVPRALAGPGVMPSRLTCAECNLRAGGQLRAVLAAERLGEHNEPDRSGLVFDWPA